MQGVSAIAVSVSLLNGETHVAGESLPTILSIPCSFSCVTGETAFTGAIGMGEIVTVWHI